MTLSSSSRSTALVSLTVSLAAAMICFLITGTSLDLFLGSIFLAAIVTPALCAQSQSVSLSALAVTAGFAFGWLGALGSISLMNWMRCMLILASFVAAIAYAVELLKCLGIPGIAASSIVTIASLAWLSWPIWFVGSGPIAIHPVFAINSACREMGMWTEQRIAYHLTTLGQDIPYRLPASVMPAIFTHGILAFVFNRITQKISHR